MIDLKGILKNSHRTERWWLLLLASVFLAVFSYYGVWSWWDLGPFSVHKWRQSDSASQALTYFQNGFDFFNHQVHHLGGGEGKSVSEFPILYYCSAILYSIFGTQDGILRSMHLFILFLGVYGFYKVLKGSIKNNWLALAGVLFFLSSPVIAFYGFNFLPNTAAFGFALFAVWFYYRYRINGAGRDYLLSILWVTLAGLIKPTILVIALAWFGTWLFINIFYKNPYFHLKKWFPKPKKVIIGFAVILTVNLTWIAWVKYYNSVHNSENFLTTIYPVWSISMSEVERIWQMIWAKRFTRLFYQPFFIFLLFWTIKSFFRLKKFELVFRWFFTFLWLGALSIFILFYFQYQHHDYYLIDIMYAPLASMAIFLFDLQKGLTRVGYPDTFFTFSRWQKNLVVIIIFGFAFWNIQNAKGYLNTVTAPNHSDMSGMLFSYYENDALKKKVKEIGLDFYSDKAFVIGDPTFNFSLYHLNLRGYTHINADIPTEKWEMAKSNGCNVLVLNNQNYATLPAIQPHLGKELGNYKSQIFFFELKN